MLACVAPCMAGVSVTGSPVVTVDVPSSLGYTKVYVVRDASQATIEYQTSRPVTLWERFSSLGAAYAEPVGGVSHSGDVYSIRPGAGDMGYRLTVGGDYVYFWVVDYAAHEYSVSSLEIAPDTDCGRAVLGISGRAGDITVYGISGRPEVLDRDIRLSYNTLVYNPEDEQYEQIVADERFKGIDHYVSVPAPLCDTEFTLSPDKFALEWHLAGDVVSSPYTAVAVEAHTSAMQNVVSSDNEQKSEGADGSLGGSAPCEISFKAVVSDAAVYRRWEISDSPDFEDVQYTYDQTDFDFTFTEAGMTYVRFTANNALGTCEYIGDTYTISIGESRLLCPNAFSPGTSEGVNDEWKVSYRSIVSFDCQIFNRWGKRLATLTDPSQGWDGMVGGKPVQSGVYFYVIKAKGADGKEYKLSGDINVISSRQNNSGNGGGGSSPAE